MYDISDEISAFTRQYAFTRNSNMYSVTPGHVRGLTNSAGIAIYAPLVSGPLDINTPYGAWAINQRLPISSRINIETPYTRFMGIGIIYNKR